MIILLNGKQSITSLTLPTLDIKGSMQKLIYGKLTEFVFFSGRKLEKIQNGFLSELILKID
jgi:hypothetical protein